jgi:hypothetical protein
LAQSSENYRIRQRREKGRSREGKRKQGKGIEEKRRKKAEGSEN